MCGQHFSCTRPLARPGADGAWRPMWRLGPKLTCLEVGPMTAGPTTATALELDRAGSGSTAKGSTMSSSTVPGFPWFVILDLALRQGESAPDQDLFLALAFLGGLSVLAICL